MQEDLPEKEPLKRNISRKRRRSFYPKNSKWSACKISLVVIGILVFIFTFILICGGYDSILNASLQSQMELYPGSPMEEVWIKPPSYLILKFYFFNITNPDEFVKGGKPHVAEIGPYVYREYTQKENVRYKPNMTVSYYQRRWWVWDQEASGSLQLTDNITILNSIPISAVYSIEGNDLLLSSMNSLFNIINEPLIMTVSVSEVMFDGYKDPLLDFTRNLMEGSPWNIPVPSFINDFDKFAWFYKRNNSASHDGIFSVYTGKSGLNDMGKIDLWNYLNETQYFDPPCNAVTGSAGQVWPPHYNKDYIQLFLSELCMTIKLYYFEDVHDDFGNPARRFWGSNKTFANYTYVPENKCYCVNDICLPTGLINAESCRMGAPVLASFPHFLNADPTLLEKVHGLKPEVEKHMFYIDLNTDIGVPLRVTARLQLNINLKPYEGKGLLRTGRIDLLASVPETVVPVLWLEVSSELPEELSVQIGFVISLYSSSFPKIIFLCILSLSLVLVLGIIFVNMLDN